MSINKDLAVQLYVSGKTLQEVGDLLGCSREYVRQIAKQRGLLRNKCGKSKEVSERKKFILEERNKKCLNKHGMTLEDYKKMAPQIRVKYTTQRSNAKKRGIGWAFTIGSWLKVWNESGKFDQRGRGYSYCMARKDDVGPYAPENVYICRNDENMSDYYNTELYKSRIAKKVVL